ncbi:hypothetical protein [Nonomuraea africana]|uniref:hypothetical protein n=1 Tax=Nonomuraea africana TaxID=46171 RepID=UPI0033E6FC1A
MFLDSLDEPFEQFDLAFLAVEVVTWRSRTRSSLREHSLVGGLEDAVAVAVGRHPGGPAEGHSRFERVEEEPLPEPDAEAATHDMIVTAQLPGERAASHGGEVPPASRALPNDDLPGWYVSHSILRRVISRAFHSVDRVPHSSTALRACASARRRHAGQRAGVLAC